MDNPISTHSTYLPPVVSQVAYLVAFIVVILVGTISPLLCKAAYVLLGALALMMIDGASVNLPYRLKIYKNGFIYRTFWGTSYWWDWSDIETIKTINRRGITTYRKLWLENINGQVIELRGLTDWPQVCQLIVAHSSPFIYEEANIILEQGGCIQVTDNLYIEKSGIAYQGQYIDWQDINFVRLHDECVVIGSRLFDDPPHYVHFDDVRTRNGIVCGLLIRELWENPALRVRTQESDYLVVNGTRFNSEGEIVAYNDEWIKGAG